MTDAITTQPSLFSEDDSEALVLSTERAAGLFTGERLRAHSPQKYQTICELLANPELSVRQVAEMTKTSRNLVAAIRFERQPEVEPHRKTLARQFRHITQLANERAIEVLSDPATEHSLPQLMIAAGTAFDKSQLVEGHRAASGFEGASSEDQDVLAYLEELRLAATRSGAETAGQKGEPAALPPAGAEGASGAPGRLADVGGERAEPASADLLQAAPGSVASDMESVVNE
jgi:hypothetical protein